MITLFVMGLCSSVIVEALYEIRHNKCEHALNGG